MVVFGCWAAIKLPSLLFQCGRPNFWQVIRNRFVDHVSLSMTMVVLNLLVRATLVALPSVITRSLNLTKFIIVPTFSLQYKSIQFNDLERVDTRLGFLFLVFRYFNAAGRIHKHHLSMWSILEAFTRRYVEGHDCQRRYPLPRSADGRQEMAAAENITRSDLVNVKGSRSLTRDIACHCL